MTDQFRLQPPVDNPIITQYFGENPDIYAKFNQAGHEGIDFAAPVGDDVYACADGEVDDIQSNNGNAYGLYIRLQHDTGGQIFHTIYAHLSQVSVSVGDRVQASDPIAQSGNTGHSFGPHLHLTLKLAGAKTTGYPDGVIDPLPFLEPDETPPSELTIHTTEKVRLRAGPTTASAHLNWLNPGEALTVLGDPAQATASIGEYGQWIHVQRASGLTGFVAAWYTQADAPTCQPDDAALPDLPPPEPLSVYATQPLNVRNGPSTGTSRIAIALPHEPLVVTGDWAVAVRKVGDRSTWLQVLTPDGLRGYVAAWYVQLTPGPAPAPLLTVYPIEDMNMRERPTVQARLIGTCARNTPLTAHDDPARARALVGRYDEWLYVETPTGERGWVAAWYVSESQVG